LFTTPGSAFRISDNGYVDVNPNYAGEFNVFSRPKLFTARGSTVTDVQFVVAGSNTQALVTGFGSVFADVGLENSTTIEYFDAAGNLLATVKAPRRSDAAGLSFVGAVFEAAIVARVRITSGKTPVDAAVDDNASAEGNPDIVVIVNPGAAGGKALKAVPVINRTLEALDCPYAIYVTKERGDAIQAARSYAESGVSRILAVGGDGTVNEVANGIYQSGSDTALGLVPVGHGTDLARHLGTTRQVDLAVQRACQGEPARIDLGLAKYADNTERAFINIAGLGFDAIVASKAQKSRLPGGNLPYLGSALTTLVGFQNLQVTIDADGQRIETAGVFVQIANAQYMGGGYHFAPMAAMDDGLLDVCIVGDFGKFELIRAIPSVYKGKHVTHSKFSHVTAKCITIETSTPAMVQLDGELVGQTPVQFSVLPAAIALVK